jgi:hypothetical protein
MQTGGNMSRMYADLLKLQKLYLEGAITAGAFILPTSKVVHMPIAVFSFE